MGSPNASVQIALNLTPERSARYSRQLALPGYTAEHQARLAAARVLVIGGGGLGSATIPYLAAAGIGTIGIVDTDTVELSNLHRQVAHGMADIGRSKIDSLTDTVAAIDPAIAVIPHPVRLDSSNALDIFAAYDLVLDGSDNFPTRYLVADAAELTGIPVVWGSILGYGGQTGLSWAAKGPRWRDLFPDPPAPGDVPSCSTGGVLPGVCATIGSLMVTEAMKLITGIGEPLLGRVTVYDALTGRFRELDYERAPDAQPVTALIDYDLFCGITHATESASAVDATAAAVASADTAELETELTPERLAQLADRVQLIDVREPWEAAIASIPGSELIPLGQLTASLDRLADDKHVVLYCHTGVRSAHALMMLDRLGVTGASHLAGGIAAYTDRVDPSLVKY